MNNLDIDVFQAAIAWRERGQQVWLCTVTSTWGSAPRKVGSLMACNDRGEQVGSLSGGCVEDDLLASVAAGKISSTAAQHIIFGATKEEAERLKLPCGGTLGVLIEPISAADDEWLSVVVKSLRQRQCITRTTHFDGQKNTGLAHGAHGEWFLLERNQDAPSRLQQVYGPQFHLFLVGASEVGRALAQFALQMDYSVTVCDPRPEKISQWEDMAGVVIQQGMPDDVILEVANDERTAIVALTHDPRIDDMGLLEAFNTRAFYIGAMGSAATSAKRRERLQSLGISTEQLTRLHAPIGLDIGSKTPSEIAIAILAELTQVRSAAERVANKS